MTGWSYVHDDICPDLSMIFLFVFMKQIGTLQLCQTRLTAALSQTLLTLKVSFKSITSARSKNSVIHSNLLFPFRVRNISSFDYKIFKIPQSVPNGVSCVNYSFSHVNNIKRISTPRTSLDQLLLSFYLDTRR